jgi:hypothetical protein
MSSQYLAVGMPTIRTKWPSLTLGFLFFGVGMVLKSAQQTGEHIGTNGELFCQQQWFNSCT